MIPKIIITHLGQNPNIVDVGCCQAFFKNDLAPQISSNAFWVGIDPMDHGVGHLYNKFINKAVVNQKYPGQTLLYVYSDLGCNSIRRMNTKLITHDISEFDIKWYVDRNIETLQNTYMVPTDSLFNMLKEFNFNVIDFVKIDTQGTDLDVLKSLGDMISKVRFIMIESITSHRKNLTLYEGQSIFEEDTEFLNNKGFNLISMENFADTKIAWECNAYFYNTHLVQL